MIWSWYFFGTSLSDSNCKYFSLWWYYPFRADVANCRKCLGRCPRVIDYRPFRALQGVAPKGQHAIAQRQRLGLSLFVLWVFFVVHISSLAVHLKYADNFIHAYVVSFYRHLFHHLKGVADTYAFYLRVQT